jgi:hypothetical protein
MTPHVPTNGVVQDLGENKIIYYGTDHRLLNDAVSIAEYACECHGLFRWVMLKGFGR